MKHLHLKKIKYLLICLFLVCNFFCISNNDYASHNLSANHSNSSVIHVPSGIHMELLSETNTTITLIQAKKTTQKSLSLFRYLLFASLLIWGEILFLHIDFYYSKQRNHSSLFLIIRFIHNKDGRKRA